MVTAASVTQIPPSCHGPLDRRSGQAGAVQAQVGVARGAAPRRPRLCPEEGMHLKGEVASATSLPRSRASAVRRHLAPGLFLHQLLRRGRARSVVFSSCCCCFIGTRHEILALRLQVMHIAPVPPTYSPPSLIH
jgi:hypothetical protein